MQASVALGFVVFMASAFQFEQPAFAAPRCAGPDYSAWDTVNGSISLAPTASGVQVDWPAYPECDQGGIDVRGYQLFYGSNSGDVELYSGPLTWFEFASGNTSSCVRVRAFSGRGGGKRYTSFLEHSNCTSQPGNQPPTAVIEGPAQLSLGDEASVTATFDGAGSSDPEEGGVSGYEWTAEAGVTLDTTSTAQVTATFAAAGTYVISLEVTDSTGLGDSASKSVSVQSGSNPPPDPDTAILGRWSPVLDWPLIAIHTVLLPDGRVLSFGTDDLGTQGAQYFYDVWSPLTGAHQTLPNTTDVDFFCSAPVLMPDSGDVLMPGGDARAGDGYNKGIVNTPVFDSGSGTVSYDPVMDMSYARWYPSSILLSDGSVHVMGGIDLAGNTSVTSEVFDVDTDSWRSLLGVSIQSLVDEDGLSYFYPRQWVVPGWDGQLFGYAQSTMFKIDPNGDLGSFTELGSLPNTSWGHYSTAVMYEPGKILQVGGNGGGRYSGVGAVIMDLTGTSPDSPQPSIESSTSMYMDVKRKAWLNSTVLPDGSVFVNGGSAAVNKLSGDLTTPELWDPESRTFRKLATSRLARLYHSTSLLLADGRVLVAGGGAPGPLTNLNAEIYSPPYLFDETGNPKQGADRIVMGVPDQERYTYGSSLIADYSGPLVSSVSLVKTGSVTHSINLEQRRIPLQFSESGGLLSIDLPNDATVATPGHYMVFLLDEDGTPSNARIVKLQVAEGAL